MLYQIFLLAFVGICSAQNTTVMVGLNNTTSVLKKLMYQVTETTKGISKK